MTFEELRDFLLNKMSMSHIYQPLVVRTLLENKGHASIRQMAKEFLSYDEAQVEYYIGVVKRWPRITLVKHHVILAGRDYWDLNMDDRRLADEQREELIQICNEKIKEYISSYKVLSVIIATTRITCPQAAFATWS